MTLNKAHTVEAGDACIKTLCETDRVYIVVKKPPTVMKILPPSNYGGSSDEIVYKKIAVGHRAGVEVISTAVAYKKEQGVLGMHVTAGVAWTHKKLAVGTLGMALPFSASSKPGRVSCHINIKEVRSKLSSHSSNFQDYAQSLLFDSYLTLTTGLFVSLVDRGQLDEAVLFSPAKHAEWYKTEMLQ